MVASSMCLFSIRSQVGINQNVCIIQLMIHQIFLLACDWSICSTWPNIPQLKLSDIPEYTQAIFPIHSFPWALLSKNCLHLGTDNVCRQIFVHIFLPNRGFLFIIYIYNNCFWLIHLPSILGLSSLGCLLNCSVWGNINKNWTSSDLTKKMKWTKKERNLSHSKESCKHS